MCGCGGRLLVWPRLKKEIAVWASDWLTNSAPWPTTFCVTPNYPHLKGVEMNRLERWFLQRVLRNEVTHGYDHDKRISALYGMIRAAAEDEFTEDNAPTLSDFLSEQFEKTQVWPFGKPYAPTTLQPTDPSAETE